MARSIEVCLVVATEIIDENVDRLLEPKGRYIGLQAKTWQHTMAGLDENVRASLEYPLGAIDLVFHVVPAADLGVDAIRELLSKWCASRRLCLVSSDDEKWLRQGPAPRGRSYDEPTQRKVHELMNGLAVDFFAWTQAS